MKKTIAAVGIAALLGFGAGYFARDYQLKTENQPPIQIETKAETKTETIEQKIEQYYVTRIVDGDTFVIADGGKVRILYINAPELHNKKTKQKDYYADEAKSKLEELINNKNVVLEKDVSETDRYGRLLRSVYLDKTDIGKYLVENGYAEAKFYKPDLKKENEYKEAEQKAKDAKKGIWQKK
jgi:micrococcal nuclease